MFKLSACTHGVDGALCIAIVLLGFERIDNLKAMAAILMGGGGGGRARGGDGGALLPLLVNLLAVAHRRLEATAAAAAAAGLRWAARRHEGLQGTRALRVVCAMTCMPGHQGLGSREC